MFIGTGDLQVEDFDKARLGPASPPPPRPRVDDVAQL